MGSGREVLYCGAVEGAAIEVSLFEALAEWMGFPAYYTMYGVKSRRAAAPGTPP